MYKPMPSILQTPERTVARLLLLSLPAGINEFLVGATPLEALVTNPMILPFVIGFYGAGVVALREIVLRMRQGIPSLLVLGMGFGIILEGLVARTFFSTAHAQVGFLATYGNWLGVNWVWAVLVTLGNALFTVVLPVLMVHLYYPALQKALLLSTPQLVLALGSFLAFPVIANLCSPPHLLPVQLIITTLLLLVLLVVARTLPPGTRLSSSAYPRARPIAFFLVGFLFNVFLFTVSNGIPIVLPPVGAIGLLIMSYAALGWWVVCMIGQDGNAQRQFALISGLLAFFFVIDVVRAATGNVSILLVAAMFVLFLFGIYRNMHRACDAT